ncbi:MAG: glycosyltransferase family 4 protein [Clostridia bacterium]
MNIWLIKANEPMTYVDPKNRAFRMGLIAQELDLRGHNITWFASTFDHIKKVELFNKDNIINVNNRFSVNLIWSPKYKKNISIKRAINHLYLSKKIKSKMKILKKPDVILVSFPIIELAQEAIEYGNKNNIPVIIDIRDLWPDIFDHNLKGILKILAKPYIYLMNRKTVKIMKEAYAITSISPGMLDWGLKKTERKKTDLDRFFYMGYEQNKNTKNIRSNFKIDKSKLNICFFGSITGQLDICKMIDIMNKLKDNKDIHFIICGDGPKYEELLYKTKDLVNVEIIGWINKNELIYILNNVNIGIAPYKNSFDFQMSVSNKFAEYLSKSLPIVMTSEGYMKQLLDDNNCGFASTNVDEICKYILKIKNNIDMYKIISQNAYKLYEEKFIAEKVYSEFVDYLENIVENYGSVK